MAQPVGNSSGNRRVGHHSDSDSDSEDITASQASRSGGGSPGQPGASPAVRTTPTTTGGQMANLSATQPSPTGRSIASGSQPAFTSVQKPSARELALRASADLMRTAMGANDPLKALKTIFKNAKEVRLVLPAVFVWEVKSAPYRQLCGQKWLKHLPIRHLDLRLAPTPDSRMQRLAQMHFLTQLITGLNELPNSENPASTVELDLPMVPGNSNFASMDDISAKLIRDALASSKVVVRVRVKDFQPDYDLIGSLVFENEILSNNKKITELELADCEFDDKVAGQIADALKENTSIKTLVLNNCSISEAGRAALAMAFSNRPDLWVVGFVPQALASSAPRRKPLDGSGGTASKGSAALVLASTGRIVNISGANTANSFTTTTTTTTATTATTATTTATATSTSTPTSTSTISRLSANFRTAHSNGEHEAELAASASEVQAALTQKDPAPALMQLFNKRASVRIDVPSKILWKAEDANGVGDGYEKFSGVKCLSALKLRNIEFSPQPCQAGENQSCQFDFLAYTLDSLNQLPKKNLVNTNLAIVLPDAATEDEASAVIARGQDGLLKSLARDRLTARLDLGALSPRTEGSVALCRFFDSLPGKTRLL